MSAAAPWLPYCGEAPGPGALLGRWNGDPVLLLLVAGFALLLWRAAPDRRGQVLTLSALALAVLLFVSPFCALTSALFAARSAHHVLLTVLLAPILAMIPSRPLLGRLPGNLAVWTALAAVTLWLWHAPGAYAAALSSDLLYWLMQVSLLGTATGFWIALRRTATGPAIAALLTYMVQMGLLGALLTFSSTSFYAPHALTTLAWGLSPVEDQQLGGIIMWVPGAAAYLAAAVILLRRLLEPARRPAVA